MRQQDTQHRLKTREHCLQILRYQYRKKTGEEPPQDPWQHSDRQDQAIARSPSKISPQTPRSDNSDRNANGSIISAKPPIVRLSTRPAITHSTVKAATAAAATAGRSAAPSPPTSWLQPTSPRHSTRTAPVAPSACGGDNIGSGAVSRSLRVAAIRAVMRSTVGNTWCRRTGSGNAAR